MCTEVSISQVFVKVEILHELWEVLAEPALWVAGLVRRGPQLGQLGRHQRRRLRPAARPLQPVAQEGVQQAVPGGEVADQAGPVQRHIAALRTAERDRLGQQGRYLLLEAGSHIDGRNTF